MTVDANILSTIHALHDAGIKIRLISNVDVIGCKHGGDSSLTETYQLAKRPKASLDIGNTDG